MPYTDDRICAQSVVHSQIALVEDPISELVGKDSRIGGPARSFGLLIPLPARTTLILINCHQADP